MARLFGRQRVVVLALVAWAALGGLRSSGQGWGMVQAADGEAPGSHHLYIPAVQRAPTLAGCALPTSYSLLPVAGGPLDRDDALHPDLNLAVRGWQPTSAHAGLLLYNGATDTSAPQLAGLFADGRTPTFPALYRVYEWDWAQNRRGGLIESWPVTLVGMGSTAGEALALPNRSGGEIDAAGYKALVIYASEQRITLKYTRDNNVVSGYTLHIEGICVEPRLLALYREGNAGGRARLPALRPGQPFGRAQGSEIRVAIRDSGSFMDPRSCKDWWAGRCAGVPPAWAAGR